MEKGMKESTNQESVKLAEREAENNSSNSQTILNIDSVQTLKGRVSENHSPTSNVRPEIFSSTRQNSVNHYHRGKKKINDEELLEALGKGLSQNKIARAYGMSRIAVYHRIKKLGNKALPYILQKDSKLFGKQLKTMEQLAFINSESLKMIGDEETPKMLKLQAMKRVEQQNEMQIRIMQLLHSINEVKEFQQTVMEVISSTDSTVRDEIIKKLRNKRTIANLISS